MSNKGKNTFDNDAAYWQKVDELSVLKERQRIIEAISKTDTEKFFLYTQMLRLNNTMKKVKIHHGHFR
jgi:hypothetical protein